MRVFLRKFYLHKFKYWFKILSSTCWIKVFAAKNPNESLLTPITGKCKKFLMKNFPGQPTKNSFQSLSTDPTCDKNFTHNLFSINKNPNLISYILQANILKTFLLSKKILKIKIFLLPNINQKLKSSKKHQFVEILLFGPQKSHQTEAFQIVQLENILHKVFNWKMKWEKPSLKPLNWCK